MSDPRHTVRITRWRWDKWMLPVLAISVVIWVVSGRREFGALPGMVVFLWLTCRFHTPRGGYETPTLRGTPGAVPLLWLDAAVIALFGLAFCFDSYVLGHPFGEPLELYHVALLAPPFILMIGGVWWIERKYGRARRDALERDMKDEQRQTESEVSE